MSDKLNVVEKVVREVLIDLMTERVMSGARIIYRSPSIINERMPGLPFHCSSRSISVDR
jgi:hypothetical protein